MSLKNAQSTKFGTDTHGGPCAIASVHADNSAANMKKGNATDAFIVRNVAPCCEHTGFS